LRRTPLLLAAAGVVVAVVLFVVLRPGGDDEETETQAVATTAPATTATEPTVGVTVPPATEPPAQTETKSQPKPKPKPRPPAVAAVRLAFRDGAPVGGIAHPSVRKGRQVRIVVRADVSDHVHLHGYDLMRDVAPGKPAQLRFRASVAGVFEVELEELGAPLAELTVRP
jgi:pyruvate/2-oxoglutarate dehydrogenase complex dihydrolipoamide acyltransferase (E2) component